MTKEKNNILITKIIITVFTIIFLFILWQIFFDKNLWIDEKMSDLFSSLVSNSSTSSIKAITFLGNHKFLIPANLLLISFFLIKKRNRDALTVALVALSSLGLMSLLKNLFRRTRPDNSLIEGITNFSFPSGHAFMSIAFYGLLIWFILRDWKSDWKRNFYIITLLFLILSIGLTRIYLRVHFTTDVIAGWMLGIIWLLIVLSIMVKLSNRSEV